MDDDPEKAGCSGEYPLKGFHYWVTKGLPTRACKEYLFTFGEKPEEHKDKLKCLDTCSTEGMELVRYKGSFFKAIIGEEEIKKEIYNNGPVVATFYIYEEDFNNYWFNDLLYDQNKIYRHSGEITNITHAIKIIGWGIDPINKEKYWLCVNSWGEYYTGGVFRFIRGINDCGIESMINVGYVDKIIYSINDFIYAERDIFFSFKNLDIDYE